MESRNTIIQEIPELKRSGLQAIDVDINALFKLEKNKSRYDSFIEYYYSLIKRYLDESTLRGLTPLEMAYIYYGLLIQSDYDREYTRADFEHEIGEIYKGEVKRSKKWDKRHAYNKKEDINAQMKIRETRGCARFLLGVAISDLFMINECINEYSESPSLTAMQYRKKALIDVVKSSGEGTIEKPYIISSGWVEDYICAIYEIETKDFYITIEKKDHAHHIKATCTLKDGSEKEAYFVSYSVDPSMASNYELPKKDENFAPLFIDDLEGNTGESVKYEWLKVWGLFGIFAAIMGVLYLFVEIETLWWIYTFGALILVYISKHTAISPVKSKFATISFVIVCILLLVSNNYIRKAKENSKRDSDKFQNQPKTEVVTETEK